MRPQPLFGLKDAINLYNEQTTRSDRLWNFYFVVALGVLGFGLGRGGAGGVGLNVKSILSAGFITFSLVSYGALFVTQKALFSLWKGIDKAASGTTDIDADYKNALRALKRATPIEMVIFHFVLDIGVLVALWLEDFVKWYHASG